MHHSTLTNNASWFQYAPQHNNPTFNEDALWCICLAMTQNNDGMYKWDEMKHIGPYLGNLKVNALGIYDFIIVENSQWINERPLKKT
jgi:hypothetical protein